MGVTDNNKLVKFEVNTSTTPFTLTSSAEMGSNVLSYTSASAGYYNGYVYYIPQTGNGGDMEIRSVKNDGTDEKSVVTNFDLNGLSSNSVSLVRLGFDPSGDGWVVAKEEGTNIYHICKFKAGDNGSVVSGPTRLGTFTISGGDELVNGDLAFDVNGSMYLLVNNGDDETRIYVIPSDDLSAHTDASSNTNLSSAKWSLKNESGGDFHLKINGIAFATDGSLYISSDDALYYLDAETVNNETGTVKAKLIAETGSLSVRDLANDIFPSTTLPVSFGPINATLQGKKIALNWQTKFERNNAYFVVELSEDGKNFHGVTKVASQAENGISDTILNYAVELDLDSTGTLAGISALLLLFALPLLFKRKNWKLAIGFVLFGFMTFFYSCSKNDAALNRQNNKTFIRIAQHDADGNVHYSKVIQVIKE